MDPRHLSQLATIIELGSVTRAAERLNVTQPTLSRTIRIIEDKVGGAVLRRDRYGVTPTDIGERLAEEGRAIMQCLQGADAAIQEWRNGLKGEIRVGVGPMIAATVMGDFLTRTMISPPAYGIKLHCEYASRLVDLLKADKLDVAIIPYELNLADSQLHREKLFSDRLSVFVGLDDPLAHKSGVLAQELADHTWVSVGAISGLFDVTRDTLDELGLPAATRIVENTGDVTMTLRILETTRSCSMLPRRLMGTMQSRYRIAPVDLATDLAPRNLGLWTKKTLRDRPEIIGFTESLKTFLMELGLSADPEAWKTTPGR
jgi:DNA-binding transcriptional LysR family regulator